MAIDGTWHVKPLRHLFYLSSGFGTRPLLQALNQVGYYGTHTHCTQTSNRIFRWDPGTPQNLMTRYFRETIKALRTETCEKIVCIFHVFKSTTRLTDSWINSLLYVVFVTRNSAIPCATVYWQQKTTQIYQIFLLAFEWLWDQAFHPKEYVLLAHSHQTTSSSTKSNF